MSLTSDDQLELGLGIRDTEDEAIFTNIKQPFTKYETLREIGDGMHANIYLAEKT